MSMIRCTGCDEIGDAKDEWIDEWIANMRAAIPSLSGTDAP